MTKEELQRLSEALIKANECAMECANVSDNGSCNFDTPMLLVKMTKKQAESLPVRVSKCEYGIWRGAWFVYGNLWGQANRRTTMAEAICKSLNESGFDSAVYYQLD